MLRIDLNTGPLATAWRDNTIGTLYEIARRAPGAPVGLRIGTQEVLLFQDAGAARHILRDHVDTYRKNFGGFQGFFGESRIASDGDRWRERRDLSQPHITSAKPADVLDVSNRLFSAAADAILAARDESSGTVVDDHLIRAAAAVISEVALGFSVPNVDALVADFRAILRYGSKRHWAIGGTAGTDTVDDRQRFEQARASLARTLREVIATAPPDDERTRLVRDIAAAEARGIDPVDEIAALLFAGIDTSAAALSWALFLLAASPDLQASLRRTVRETTGGAPGTLAHLEAMPDLAAFRNEVLRIFPPIPAIGRTPIAADRIGEVPVAAGQPVMISIIGLHHDPRHFPSPASVRLKRYPPGELGSENVGHHLPFGDGRRVCVGSRIANVETSAALAVLVDRLKFALPDMRPLEFEWTASMRRKGGQYLLVRPAE